MDVPRIDVPQLPDDAVILDVREQDEWDAGHAPGAVHIPLSELPQRLEQLPDTDEGTLAVVCRSGGRSSRAVAWLTQQGFDVANLEGGMRAWQAAGKQMVAASGTPSVM
jgi:rhodanese-related sulfurtransferase